MGDERHNQDAPQQGHGACENLNLRSSGAYFIATSSSLKEISQSSVHGKICGQPQAQKTDRWIYTIREAQWWHCGAMAHKLCRDRWLAYKIAGLDPRDKLRQLFAASSFRRSVFIESRIVAMGGVTGTLLSRHGTVWCAVSPEFVSHRFSLIRIAHQQLREASRTKILHATIQEQDSTATMFAEFLGFHPEGEPSYDAKLGVRVIPMVLRRFG